MTFAVIMGVAGSGKSSVGVFLATNVKGIYIDGDELHPQSNVDKMSAGIALTDDDRAPWLAHVGETLRSASGPILIGCSALKRSYRDIIRDNAGGPVVFVHLSGSRRVIEERMAGRTNHFMPVSLIDSQFAALDMLQPDETGFSVDIDQPLELVVEQATRALMRKPEWDTTLL